NQTVYIMKSPKTGKEMVLQLERKTLVFRKEEFEYFHRGYLCRDSGETYTDTALAEFNLRQVYNQYRAKYGIPFPDEIRGFRQTYGLSAGVMSRVLGLGINSYRNYEQGEVPSFANANLIHTVSKKVENLRMLVDLNRELTPRDKTRLYKRIKAVEDRNRDNADDRKFVELLFEGSSPSRFSGFRKPNMEKLLGMIVFFAEKMKPSEIMMGQLLFYADFAHYGQTAYSISGAQYMAQNYGPMPLRYGGLFDYVDSREYISIEVDDLGQGYLGKYLLKAPQHDPKPGVFTAGELKTLDFIFNGFKGTNAQKIMEHSHEEKAWIDNRGQKQLIDYSYSFDLIHV